MALFCNLHSKRSCMNEEFFSFWLRLILFALTSIFARLVAGNTQARVMPFRNASSLEQMYSGLETFFGLVTCSVLQRNEWRAQWASAYESTVLFDWLIHFFVFREHTRCWDLSSFLIKPVQRVLKYPLLLSELLKVSSIRKTVKTTQFHSKTLAF